MSHLVGGFVAMCKAGDHYSGRFSNVMMEFMNTVRLALLTSKRLVFLPLEPQWLDILNLEGWSRMLNPSGSVCTIKGIEWPQIKNFSETFKAEHLEIEDWGPGCTVRPLHHLSHFFPQDTNVSVIGWVPAIPYKHVKVALKVGFPLLKDNGVTLVQSHPDNLMIFSNFSTHPGIISEVWPVLNIFDKNYVTSNEYLAISYSPYILELAKQFYNRMIGDSSLSHPLLCVHVRLEDLSKKTATWQQYVPFINDFISRYSTESSSHDDPGSPRVLIITNGNYKQVLEMKERVPSAVVGCAGLMDECDGSEYHSAIEQEACSMADEFIGSATSTFTYLIALKRAHRGLYPGVYLTPTDELVPIEEVSWDPRAWVPPAAPTVRGETV